MLSLIVTLNISSLKLSSLTSSQLSETLKLTLTVSRETHHLSSSSSQIDVVLAADRLRPTSWPKPQAVAGFHRRSLIQALGFIVKVATAFLIVGFSID